MLHSLRLRLLLLLIMVVAVTAITLLVLTSQVMVNQFQRYLNEDMQRNQMRVDTLLKVYGGGAAGQDLQAQARQVAATLGERVIQTDAYGLVLADSAGALVGRSLDCRSPISAVVVTVGASACAAPVMGERAALGTLLFVGAMPALPVSDAPGGAADNPTDSFLALGRTRVAGAPGDLLAPVPLTIRRTQGPGLSPVNASFIRAVNHSLLPASGVACLAALLLTALFSRHMLGPIERLTAAAYRMAQGDLGQRVHVTSRDEIGMLARAFNTMADGLGRQEQLRRTMVSDVAHELRTPLTNIRGYIEAMQDGLIEPSAAQLSSLYEETMTLSRLVEDLQDLALAEAGQLRLRREPFDLGAAVGQALHAVEPRAVAAGVSLRAELPPELPLIEADPERVGQVLRNLLANALAHTPPGGAVTVAAQVAAQELSVCVRDTGGGIAPEHLPYIFERFFRADPARRRQTGGAGLGLTIVRELVEAHGGQVVASSSPGAGAAFTFTLPRAAGLSATYQPFGG